MSKVILRRKDFDNSKSYKISTKWNIYQIAFKATPEGWEKEFEELKAAIKMISKRITNITTPSPHLVFNAFYLTQLKNVRVVFIGQDPYPQPGIANGIAFSCSLNARIPKTLEYILKALILEYPNIKVEHGDLTSWCRQGCLMLNSELTINPGAWTGFIIPIIKRIGEYNKNCIFVLYGRKAGRYRDYIASKEKYILESGHPSPANASSAYPFVGNFKRINKILRSLNEKPIDFSLVR